VPVLFPVENQLPQTHKYPNTQTLNKSAAKLLNPADGAKLHFPDGCKNAGFVFKITLKVLAAEHFGWLRPTSPCLGGC
jgi:hypothetical protein